MTQYIGVWPNGELAPDAVFESLDAAVESGWHLQNNGCYVMLRACKRRVSVDELAQIIRVVDGSNTLGAGALAEAILASLDPAPDHSEWNAAIEAAANAANQMPNLTHPSEVVAAIRNLRKGQNNDQG